MRRLLTRLRRAEQAAADLKGTRRSRPPTAPGSYPAGRSGSRRSARGGVSPAPTAALAAGTAARARGTCARLRAGCVRVNSRGRQMGPGYRLRQAEARLGPPARPVGSSGRPDAPYLLDRQDDAQRADSRGQPWNCPARSLRVRRRRPGHEWPVRLPPREPRLPSREPRLPPRALPPPAAAAAPAHLVVSTGPPVWAPACAAPNLRAMP